MFIFDILIYVIFALVMYYLAKKSYAVNPSGNKWDIYIILYILFFTIIAAIRWNVGPDSMSYAIKFSHGIPYANDGREILWTFIVNSIKNSGLHWSYGLGLIAFLQLYFILKSIQHCKYIAIMLPFVLFGGRYWLDMMGAIRQMLVTCLFIWASRYIYEKKIWKYAIFILISSLIHKSSLLLIIFYFIPQKLQIENKRILLSIILIICVIIGQTPSYQGIMNSIVDISKIIGYDYYSDSIAKMLTIGNTDEALSFGPMMLTYLLIPLFIIWFGPILKLRFGKDIPYFSLWYFLAYIYACGYFLVCNISHIFIRPMLFLSLFQMILASLLLYYLISISYTNSRNKIAAIMFSIIIFTNSAWYMYKAQGSDWESATYKVYFTHKEQIKIVGINE